jgi:hypothetical protein
MSLFDGRNCTVHLTAGRVGRSDAAPLQGKELWEWSLAGRLGCGFARPGADHGHPSNNRV